MYLTTTNAGTTATTGIYGAELAYRRERMINDFRAINDAARRRAERRADRRNRRAPSTTPGRLGRPTRVHQHAAR